MSAVLDSNAVLAACAQTGTDGGFDPKTLAYLQSVGARRRIVFLAFAPKAAGTFFRQAAIYAIGGDLFRLPHAQGGRDGVPYLPTLLALYLDDKLPEIVTHIHMQAFASNRHLMAAFGIRPVIMLRNLPDMLTSFWDMLEVDPVARAEGLNCVVPSDFLDLSQAQKADFMVDIIAPWYASYYASWRSFVCAAPAQVCVLRYREFRRDAAACLKSALTHCGFTVSDATCKEALERAWSERSSFRFNKGTEGRGKTYFSEKHLAEIARKLSHYPQLGAWMAELMGPDFSGASHDASAIRGAA